MAGKIKVDLKEKLFPMLVSRTVIFFSFMCLLTLFIYAAGTFQGFIDSTQLSLLKLYLVLGIFLAITSVLAAIVNVRRFLRNKKLRYLLRAGGYVLLAFGGIITVMAVMFIITVAKGNITQMMTGAYG